MKVVVVTPEEFMGDVIGDLNSKRGRIESMEDLAAGVKEITAFVPLGEMRLATPPTCAPPPKAAPAPAWSSTTTPTSQATSPKPSSPKTLNSTSWQLLQLVDLRGLLDLQII